MRLKSYYATSVQSAMASAVREMGAEALLVHSRKASSETRHLGEYEVVFASDDAEENSNASLSPQPSIEAPATLHLSGEIAQLRRQIESMAAQVGRAISMAGKATAGPDKADALAALLDTGIETKLALRILDGVRQQQASGGIEDSRSLMNSEIEAMLRVDATLGRHGYSKRIVAMVGPAGAGKTTTIAKLAIIEGARSRQKPHMLSMDVERIGGADQLRTFAAILGAGFDIVETPSALAAFLDGDNGQELIFIDTAGYSPRDTDAAKEVAAVLVARPDVEVQLVLPASMRPSDLNRVCDRFDMFGPSKLLFTHIDEAESSGAILSACARTGKPVSFLCTGQQVPEDIEAATVRRILQITLSQPLAEAEWRATSVAA